MTNMTEIISCEPAGPVEEREARLQALRRFLDWAEREAEALKATDAGVCLQLARLALDGARGR
jgi:hypothetical protein